MCDLFSSKRFSKVWLYNRTYCRQDISNAPNTVTDYDDSLPLRTNLRVNGPVQPVFEQLGRIRMLATGIHGAPGKETILAENGLL
jgi:hypothetical protein